MSNWKKQLRYFAAHRFEDGGCTCGKAGCDNIGKHPKATGWQQRATNDPDIVAQILNDPTANPAIATGQGSKLFVVDVDGIDGLIALAELEKANGPLPNTHKVMTGSGGWHYYFQYPSVKLGTSVRFQPGLDTRGEGGFVIGAGARSGKGSYFAKNDLEPAVMPDWLVATIRDGAKKKTSSKNPERLTKGNRNNAIFKLAASLHHAETSYEGALEACMKEAARAVPPLPESEVITAVKSAYGYPVDENLGIDVFSDGDLTTEFVASDPDLKYATDEQNWFGYRGGIWQPKETPKFEIETFLRSIEPTNITNPKLADSIHRRLTSIKAVAAVRGLAEDRPELKIKVQEFDPDPWVVGLPNGEALDLRTGERRAASHHDLITRTLSVAPEGQCQRWLDYLEQTHPGDPELVAYLQRLVGYWLTSSTIEDMVAFFIGIGGSGEGIFAEPWQKLLGRYCVSIPIGMLLEDTNEDRRLNYIADLCGARLAVCNEGSKMHRLDSRGFKMLSGGGWAVGRRMGQQPIHFKQTHKILVLANHPPVLELDDAMKQRVHVVPFTQKFRGEKTEQKGLREFFTEPEQLQGILTWGVEGCLAWQKQGLKPPASVKVTTEQYFEDADLLEQFLKDHTTEKTGSFTPSALIWQRWVSYCNQSGQPDEVGSQRTLLPSILKKRSKVVAKKKEDVRGLWNIELTEYQPQLERKQGEEFRGSSL